MGKILIVEDDLNNVEILQRLLKTQHHEVAVTHDKITAVELANQEVFDLIMMDVEILDAPDGEQNKFAGLEATQSIKSESLNKQTPIIACTAQVMMDERSRIMDAGCDELASKPYNFEELIRTIDNLMQKTGPD